MASPRGAGAATGGFEGVAASSLLVAVWTAVSRITGLGRVVMVAAVLGPTYLGNLYQATYVLPALIYQFLVGSLFVALLVPPLVRHAEVGDARRAARLAGGFVTVAGAVFVGVGTLAALAAPLLLQGFAAGVEDPTVAADQRRAGALLLALMAPQVLLLGIAGGGAAVMNAHGRFALAAAAPALENVGVMVVMLATAVLYGTGLELTDVGTPELLLLGGGSTAAVALHAGASWWGAARAGVLLRPHAGWRDPEVRSILRRAVPSLGVAGLDTLRQLAVLPVANRVPGGVVAFQLALNFANLPVALAAKPVATALLPRLSALFHARRHELLRDEFVRGTALSFLLTVPAMVAYAVLADPLARALAFGEMAAPAAVAAVAGSLAALAPGIVGDGSFWVGAHAFYAMRDATSPLISMALRTAVTLVGVGVGFALAPGTGLLVALGLALSAGNLLGAGDLDRRLLARLPAGGERLGPPFLRALGASLVMAGPAYLIAVSVPESIGERLSELLGVLVAGAVGGLTFLGVQMLWRSPELSSLLAGLRRAPATAPGGRSSGRLPVRGRR